MITKFIVVIVIIVLVALVGLLINGIEDNKKKIMSFREAIDLSELPVITFRQDGKKLNLLLDTGSTSNVIDKRIINEIKTTPNSTISRTTGLTETVEGIKNVDIEFSYIENGFKDTFQVIDMGHTFMSIKEATGVTLHGIIGNKFMQKYKYVLDFKEMIVYSKK